MSSDVMETLIKFNNQSSGRDKIFRLIQYSSRIIWAHIEKNHGSKDLINKIKNLEYTLSTARKLYRFGRCSDTMYTALKSLSLTDPALRHTISLSRISMAMYLFTDHVVWLGRAGLADVNTAKWSKISYKLWLYYLLMNLSRDMYEISRIINNFINVNEEVPFGKIYKNQSFISKLQRFCGLVQRHKDVAFDTIKNGCDVCLPLAQLGYLSLSPRTVGILGAISSITGMLPLLDPSYKLSP